MSSRAGPWARYVYRLTIAVYLADRGVPPELIRKWASPFGRLAKRRFEQIYGEPPGKVPSRVNQIHVHVFAYRAIDVPMLDELWDEFQKRMQIDW